MSISGSIITKLLPDITLDFGWTFIAKNDLHSFYGFSFKIYFLVEILTSLLINKTPALDGKTN